MGLARFIGKNNSVIVYWVKRVRLAQLIENSLPEPLKPFAGQPLTLMGYTDSRGRDILEDRFCSALIEYFAWWAQDADGNHKAKKAFSLIRDVGMRQLIHLKTGWRPECSDDKFEKIVAAHEERMTARVKLKDKDRVELMNAVKEWQIQHKASRKLFSDVHDELNKVIQSLTSRQIKHRNGLAKSALIRDYYDTYPLIDYGSLSRMTANLIRWGIDPLEAVHLAAVFYFSSERIPNEVPLMENIHKVTKILKAQKQERKLNHQNHLYLPNSDPEA